MNVSRAAVAAAIVVVAALLASSGPAALANGAGTEIFRGTEGPFELVVRVQPEEPAIGAVHVTFEPTVADTAEPVEDAVIEVLARDAEGADRYVVVAVNTPQERQYYDANITFHEAGEWTLVVDVEQAGTGSATFNVPMTVQPQLIPPRGVVGTVAWLLISAVRSSGESRWSGTSRGGRSGVASGRTARGGRFAARSEDDAAYDEPRDPAHQHCEADGEQPAFAALPSRASDPEIRDETAVAGGQQPHRERGDAQRQPDYEEHGAGGEEGCPRVALRVDLQHAVLLAVDLFDRVPDAVANGVERDARLPARGNGGLCGEVVVRLGEAALGRSGADHGRLQPGPLWVGGLKLLQRLGRRLVSGREHVQVDQATAPLWS